MTPLEILEAKAHLVGWAFSPGAQPPLADYGSAADAANGMVWTQRDGAMLAAFAQSRGLTPVSALTPALLFELRKQSTIDVTKFVPPGIQPTHVPVVDPACASACVQQHPTDPIAAAVCSAGCVKNAEVSAGAPMPATPPPASPPTPSTPAPSKKASGLVWVLGGVAAAALLYLVSRKDNQL